jgi:tetratricopeptide (TPR) repeat protein
LGDPAGLPQLFVCGPPELAEWCAGATLNTDNHPLIEFSSPKSLFLHKQKEMRPVHDFLAGVRSHSWPFDQQPTEEPVQDLFRISDLVIAAQQAFSENNFESEFQRVSQLARLAGDSPSVAVYVMSVANRYEGRQMSDRSTKLLEALIAFPEPPVPALVALAQAYLVAGNDQRAIELLEEAVKRSSEVLGPRKTLADMLDREGEYAKAEPHLRELIKLQPEDPFLRIDLAKNLHRQKKPDEARAAIDDFLDTWDGSKRKEVWRYLRTSGLGPYVDRMAPREKPSPEESLPEDRPSTEPPPEPGNAIKAD